ncbi:25169_t:CDS:2, partial [Racocetra persica]
HYGYVLNCPKKVIFEGIVDDFEIARYNRKHHKLFSTKTINCKIMKTFTSILFAFAIIFILLGTSESATLARNGTQALTNAKKRATYCPPDAPYLCSTGYCCYNAGDRCCLDDVGGCCSSVNV